MNGIGPQLAVRFTMLTKVLVAVGVFTFALSAEVHVAEAADPIGTVREFSIGIRDGLAPRRITAGPDGNLWFTEFREASVGRITPEGVVTEFTSGISPGTIHGITAGPDGNLWFTNHGSDPSFVGSIGRITPDGVVTEFFDGLRPRSRPSSITAGSDGNLWFVEFNSDSIENVIGRITPDGVITEFPTGIDAGTNLGGITSGPDGNLWFTRFGHGGLGRITTDGLVTEFPGPAIALWVTAGPDGNLWFTVNGDSQETFQGSIVRMTLDGEFTVFTAGISPGALDQITAASDGNLWFTELHGNKIGRITTDGVVTEFSDGISGDSWPSGITSHAATGSIWFTHFRANKIGMRVVSEPLIAPPIDSAPPATPIDVIPTFTG